MDPTLYIAYLLVSAAFIVAPGPNVIVTVSTSLAKGRLRGLQAVAGATVAMALQLSVAALGTVWIANALSEAFTVLKGIGAVYLIYLGWVHLRSAIRPGNSRDSQAEGSRGTFWRGFIVAITNPKTILFFGAFLPQFTVPASPIGWQIAVLSVSFLALATAVNIVYAIVAGALNALASRPGFRRWCDGFTGVLFVGSGIGLAISRRS